MQLLRRRWSGADVAVVLGGGLLIDGTPHPSTLLRAEACVTLAQAHPKLTVILSGDGRITEAHAGLETEAAAMAAVLKRRGISRRRLVLEDESIDTIGNAILVAVRYLHKLTPRTLYVVTSPFHATRARLLFEAVLGPAWRIEIIEAAPAFDDAEREAMETGGIDWTKRFFAEIPAGNLVASVAKLQEIGKDCYRTNARLNRARKQLQRREEMSVCGV